MGGNEDRGDHEGMDGHEDNNDREGKDGRKEGGDAPTRAFRRALGRLAFEHSEAALVLALREFDGLSLARTASRLDLAPRTVHARWIFARAWIRRALLDKS